MDLNLDCANIIDEGKGITIPPKNANRYPTKIGVKALKEYKRNGMPFIEIPVVGGRVIEKE